MKKGKSVAMTISLSVYGSVSYLSKPKKLCTLKLDDNMLNPDGALFMQLDTTKCHLQIRQMVIQGVHCIYGWDLTPREVLLNVKLVM